MDFPSFKELFRIARDEALVRNTKLSKDEIERKGSDLNIILASACAAADECVGQISRIANASFLDTAKRTDLDYLVYDRYGLLRKVASPSYTKVQFTTSATTASSFSIPDGTLLSTKSGLQFITVGTETFPALSTGPVEVTVRSVEAGESQKCKSGEITVIVSTIVSAPQDLAVTNSRATFGGDEEEQDNELRQRAREFFSSIQKGTTAAIRSAVLAFPGVKYAQVFEELDTLGRPSGIIKCVIADAYTDIFVSTISPTLYSTQSDVLAAQIEAALDDVRPAGVPVDVIVSNVVLQPITLSLAYRAGYASSDVFGSVQGLLQTMVNNLGPGEALRLSAIQQELQRAEGVYYTGTEVLTPNADVVPTVNQVIRTNKQLISKV
jgi:uncharacterized phage protein gp47/JayE